MSKRRTKTVDEMLDEFRGQGGSYVVNPESGQRELVERTAPAEDQPVMEQDNGTSQA